MSTGRSPFGQVVVCPHFRPKVVVLKLLSTDAFFCLLTQNALKAASALAVLCVDHLSNTIGKLSFVEGDSRCCSTLCDLDYRVNVVRCKLSEGRFYAVVQKSLAFYLLMAVRNENYFIVTSLLCDRQVINGRLR